MYSKRNWIKIFKYLNFLQFQKCAKIHEKILLTDNIKLQKYVFNCYKISL